MSSSTALCILKRELRKRVRASLDALPSATIAQESEVVTQLLLTDVNYVNAKSVALFSSMAKEFDTSALIRDAFENGKRVFMPRVISKERREMKVLECFSLQEITKYPANYWGIHEPPEDGRPEAPKDVHLDVLVIPGVAFDLSGARCGHGKGFYDRYLAMYKQKSGKVPYICAPALSPQIVDSVPVSEFDHRVDKVVSVRSVV